METIKQKADKWWRELPSWLRVKYASEKLSEKGRVLKYNSFGTFDLTILEVVEIYNSYLENYKIDIAINLINEKIIKSTMPNNQTKRTGDYRIGLNKAIDILYNLK